mmetsp:Transcript_10634/g.32700  ORF Transcript_10634/g.32700 Transcript_10634/m.32700 type:complete len:327 (-) Transcript_10634:32-1012(-)
MLKALTNVRKEARSWTDSFGNLVSSPSSSSMFGEPPKDAEKASPASGGLSDASYDSDDDQGCCARHFGTDALLGSWCLAVASALYALYGLDLVVDSWDSDDVTWVTFAWGNAVSGLLFTVGACYFVNISYPEEMERCAREALTVDVSTLTFMERTFTFNDMLLATWSFELGCVPYVVIALAYLCDSDEAWLGGVMLVGVVVTMLCIYVWCRSAMPENMQKNGGTGSSSFYDAFIAPCCGDRFLRKHLGTDLQVGGWLFFGPTAVATVASLALVCVDPTSFDAWSFFVQLALFSVGAGLLLRSMYPPAMEETPLLASPIGYAAAPPT